MAKVIVHYKKNMPPPHLVHDDPELATLPNISGRVLCVTRFPDGADPAAVAARMIEVGTMDADEPYFLVDEADLPTKSLRNAWKMDAQGRVAVDLEDSRKVKRYFEGRRLKKAMRRATEEGDAPKVQRLRQRLNGLAARLANARTVDDVAGFAEDLA